MLASSFSSVVLPDPLRPATPRSSPSAAWNETPRRAWSIVYSIGAKGCTARSFSVITRWLGTRKDLWRPLTSTTIGRSVTPSPRSAVPEERAHPLHQLVVERLVPVAAPPDLAAPRAAPEVVDAGRGLAQPGADPL